MTAAERFRYLNSASSVAMAGVLEALYSRGLGHLERWSCTDSGDLAQLEIVFCRGGDAATRIRYTRALLGDAADKDAETAGLIFSASFEERVTTREAGPSGPDGIAEL